MPHRASAEQSPTTRGGARRPSPGGGRLTPETWCRGGHPGGPAQPPGPAGGQDEHLRNPRGRNAGPRGRGATENGGARSSSGLAEKAGGRRQGGEAQRMNEMEEAPQYPNHQNGGAPCRRAATTPHASSLPLFFFFFSGQRLYTYKYPQRQTSNCQTRSPGSKHQRKARLNRTVHRQRHPSKHIGEEQNRANTPVTIRT